MALRGLRVLFVVGTLGQGGAERQLYYLLAALQMSGARPVVCSLTRGEFWEPYITRLGIPILWFGQSQSRLLRLLRLVKCVFRERPQVIQSQHFYCNLYAGLAARAFGEFSIGAVRSNVHSEIQDGGRMLGTWQLRMPHRLAANSSAALRTLKEMRLSPARLHFLPNVVDTECFRPSPTIVRRTTVILGVGRLVPEKRFDSFLHVLAEVRRCQTTPVQGVIVGAGPLRNELERLAGQLGLLPDGVEFRGPVADTSTLFHGADLFLLTSDYEGTPNVVLEAMASGLPVVATRVGDMPELVADQQTGRLCEPGNVSQITETVLRLLADAEERRRIAKSARRFVEAARSVSSLPERLAELYSQTGA